MIFLRSEEIHLALPMAETIEAMKTAYAVFSKGDAEVPQRLQMDIAPHFGTSIFMPSFIHDGESDSLALKTVSVFPKNGSKGLPTIHAAVMVLDPETGRIEALLEGSSLTSIRTGAASGAAIDILSRREANSVALFGAGVQGRTQLEAICAVRNIKRILVYDPNQQKANEFLTKISESANIPKDLRIARTPDEAACNAEIICTATTSKTPVYQADSVQPGTHVNGIGSYTLDMVENPPELIKNSNTFVDSVSATMSEAGEIVEAIRNNYIKTEGITEIGDVILGKAHGRISDNQITFFKSVGIAVQDALAAHLALKNAKELNLGEKISW